MAASKDISVSPHIFISYSHKDTAFVKDIVEGLISHDKKVWVDWEGIPPTSKWWTEILKAIEGASAFVFIASQNSIGSDVCRQEIEYAASTGKRIIPVVFSDVRAADVHPAIAEHQWIRIAEQEALNLILSRLIEAIELDLDWNERHARLLRRMREWEQSKSHPSYFLRGRELDEAEAWLDKADGASRKIITPLQQEFIENSRIEAAARWRRIFLPALLSTLIVLFPLQATSKALRTDAAPSGIVSLELARTFEQVQSIQASWDFRNGMFAALNLGLDFLFVLLYVGTLLSICLYFATSLKRRAIAFSRVGSVLSVLIIMGGLFDIFENVSLINLLFGSQSPIYLLVLKWSSVPKFLLILLTLLYALITSLRYHITSFRRKQI